VKRYAFLTGKVVNAGSASREDSVATLTKVIESQNKRRKAEIKLPLTASSAGEFQGLISTLSASHSIMRELRLDLLSGSVDCGLTVGTLVLETALTPDLKTAVGQSLRVGCKKPDHRPNDPKYNFVFPDRPHWGTVLHALGGALAYFEQSWTTRQLADIKASLAGKSVADIAKKRKVSVHSVHRVRNAGAFATYSLLWDGVAEAFAAIDESLGLR
jgi:hypothetical protein